MPVTPTSLVDHYVLIAEFIGAGGQQPWRSEFHIEGTPGVTPGPTDSIVNECEGYWTACLRTDASLSSVQLRHWTYGLQPFSAQSTPIWIKAVGAAGTKTGPFGAQSTHPLGREVCAFIKLSTSQGKPGKQFLRLFIDELDVQAVAGGDWFLAASPPANVTQGNFHSVMNGSIGPFVNAVSTPRLCVVHFSTKRWNANPVSANAPFSSPVTDVALIRPANNKSTRKNKR